MVAVAHLYDDESLEDEIARTQGGHPEPSRLSPPPVEPADAREAWLADQRVRTAPRKARTDARDDVSDPHPRYIVKEICAQMNTEHYAWLYGSAAA